VIKLSCERIKKEFPQAIYGVCDPLAHNAPEMFAIMIWHRDEKIYVCAPVYQSLKSARLLDNLGRLIF